MYTKFGFYLMYTKFGFYLMDPTEKQGKGNYVNLIYCVHGEMSTVYCTFKCISVREAVKYENYCRL